MYLLLNFMQGNFCIYAMSDEEATSTATKSNKPAIIKEEQSGGEKQTEDSKDGENKINKTLKLSVGLPSLFTIEVKVMVYIIRVRLQYLTLLFRNMICFNFVQLVIF